MKKKKALRPFQNYKGDSKNAMASLAKEQAQDLDDINMRYKEMA